MAKVGRIESFDETDGNWALYSDRLDQFFVANHVAEDRKVAVLLSLIGGKTYALLHSLCAPQKPADKTLDQIRRLMNAHLNPQPNEIAERYRFNTRQQQAAESVSEYIAVLQKLSEKCNFGAQLTTHFRDRLVSGIRDEATLKELLAVGNDLTWENAKTKALSMEMAQKDVTEIRQSKSKEVNKVFAKREKVDKKRCFRCGRNHTADECHFKDAKCHRCGEKGHIQRKCPKEKAKNSDKTDKNGNKRHRKPYKKKVFAVDEDSGDSDDSYYSDSSDLNFASVHGVNGSGGGDPIILKPRVNGVKFKMELDTGSALSLISSKDHKKYFPKERLHSTDVILKTYTKELVRPEGYLKVKVKYEGQNKRLRLYVLKDAGPPLYGREWINKIKPPWKDIKMMKQSQQSQRQQQLDELLNKYKSVFSSELGVLKGIKAKFHLKEDTKPVFCKPRQVPIAMKDKVGAELDNMVAKGVLTPVDYSEWAAPIVPILKKDGSVRICGDFKVTVNPHLEIDQYPLPSINAMLANLSGGDKFTKIDLKTAYLQMEVDEDSKQYVTINTHKGLFRFNRLAYGIGPAASIWQKAVEIVLQGLPKVQVILDDMIITGAADSDHLQNVENVLRRLEEFGLRVNPEKCQFFKDSVEFCAHVIDKDGIHKTDKKIKAVVNAPIPTNVSEVRTWIAMVEYYHKFLPNLSTVLAPLFQLLHANHKWEWTKECDRAVEKTKEMMTSDLVLAHYDPKLPLKLHCDASSYGISAVISHVYPDKSERPISFASRTLTTAERNYAQIDREALSIIFGVKKFNMYLYARKFTLVTDCKVLVSIFNPKKGIPMTTAARMQRYALFLAGYDYDISYRKTSEHSNADGLSRFPLPTKRKQTSEEKVVFYASLLDSFPVTFTEIAKSTVKDPILSKVLEFTRNGWPTSLPDTQLASYCARQAEITISQECLVWGNRIIVPEKHQDAILKELHSSHPGIVKMKSLARSYVWWPHIDKDIETVANTCAPCISVLRAPPQATVHSWEFPDRPWSRIHIDFFGPFQGHMFIVVVDAHSRWVEIRIMDKITSQATIEVLQELFSAYGICDTICTDNGSAFVSETFQKFLKLHGIKHKLTTVYKPSRNGLAERMVGTAKSSLKAMKNENLTMREKVIKFLLMYRTTKNATTNETPANLFLKRELKTRLNLVKPVLKDIVHRNTTPKDEIVRRSLNIGEEVMVRDYRSNREKWIYGVIKDKVGTLTYDVSIGDTAWRRHIDQIRKSRRSLDEIIENPVVVGDKYTVERPDPPAPPAVTAETVIAQQQPIAEQLPVEKEVKKSPVKSKPKVKKQPTVTVKDNTSVTATPPVQDIVSKEPVIPVTKSGRQIRKPKRFDN